MNLCYRIIARLLIITTAALSMPMQNVNAGIIATDEIAAPAAAQRAKVENFLQRAEVQTQLQAMGVDPAHVRARVSALTDAEIDRLASKLDQMPAGGADFLAVIVFIFLVLLITDILGLTKIFPFTKPVR